MYLNTARAVLHDTDALVPRCNRADRRRRARPLRRREPPARPSALRRSTNVVLTPHIGGATYDTEVNHSKLIADGLVTLLEGGRPDNLVNPEVLR